MPNTSSSLFPVETSVPLWPDAGLEELLELARARYNVDFEPVSVAGLRLEILQITDMKARLDRAIAQNALADALNTLPLWAKVWPASILLGHSLRHIAGTAHAILEIGAGCGIAGLAAAGLGLGKVCITDIHPDALLFARINIVKNGLQDRAEVRHLDIAADSAPGRFSLILGAEILYLEHLYRPLVKFFQRHLAAGLDAAEKPQALLASDHRRKIRPFLKKAEKAFSIATRQIGIREKNAGQAENDCERHLIDIIRLTPLH